MSLARATSPAADAIRDAISSANSREKFAELAGTIWRSFGDGVIREGDAEALQSLLDLRRGPSRNASCGAPGRKMGQFLSRLVPRQRPRSPDRKASRDRRRTLGGSAVLPPKLRENYTEGQRAVLAIIAGEIKHHGVCDLPIDKIAALAGVCRTSVQNTLHEARRLRHLKITERPQSGRKSLTNLIEIVSAEWRAWIKRGPTAHRPIGSKFPKIVSPTKSKELKNSFSAFDMPISENERRAMREGIPRRLWTTRK
ncbi:MAG: hypothetical protein EKK29_09540 [Hyphomicrobiales bacterium]|nr:MAG: hypothetical protein EKK29_09540 [Hyphomicrobiales bacterium]